MRTLTLLLAMFAGMKMMAANDVNNDTVVVNNPQKVVVITSDSLQQIQIVGSDHDPNYRYENTIQLVDSNYVSESKSLMDDLKFSLPFNKKSEKTSFEVCATLAFGWNGAMGMDDRAKVEPFSSWEIWWIVADTYYRPWKNNHAFSFGVGLDWRNWRITDDYRFVETGNDNRVAIAPYPEGAKPKFSRIKVFCVNFPIQYNYEGKYFHFSLGPVVNLNTYASLKTRYTLDGNKHKDMFTNVHVKPVTVDFMATAGLAHGFDIYVKYSPFDLLQDGYGPKFRTISFGIKL